MSHAPTETWLTLDEAAEQVGVSRLRLREAIAVLQSLNAELLSHDSATLTLDRWCDAHGVLLILDEVMTQTSSPRSTPPLSRALFQTIPKSLRFSVVSASNPARCLPHGSFAAPRYVAGSVAELSLLVKRTVPA